MIQRLIQRLTELESEEEIWTLLDGLCRPAELEVVAQRLEGAQRILQGMSYSDIVREVDVPAFVLKCLQNRMEEDPTFRALVAEDSTTREVYRNFAEVYDALTQDVAYQKRCDYVETLIHRFMDRKPELVVDLACGTGTATIELAKRGYDMTGIDASQEMLGVAVRKAKAEQMDILFLNQTMQEFELYGTVDVILCLLDSMNYLLEKEDLEKCLHWVHNYLNPGGLFIFDINTKYKLETLLPGNVFTDETEGVYYTWENAYDPEEKICMFDLNFFVEENGLYRRFEEVHYEKAYTRGEIKQALRDANLKLLAEYDDLTFDAPKRQSEKIFFVAQRTQ